MARTDSNRLSPDEARQVREAERRLEALLQVAEDAHADGRLAGVIGDTPGVQEQLQSFLDA